MSSAVVSYSYYLLIISSKPSIIAGSVYPRLSGETVEANGIIKIDCY